MDNKYFSKSSNICLLKTTVGPLYAVVFVILIAYITVQPSKNRVLTSVIILLIITLAAACFIKASNKTGLYLEGDKLFYKSFFKKRKIDPKSIKAIKILKAQYRAPRLLSGKYQTDSCGNNLHTAIFLNETNEDMLTYNDGDYYFTTKFNRQIMFSVQNNTPFITALQALNPSTIIF